MNASVSTKRDSYLGNLPVFTVKPDSVSVTDYLGIAIYSLPITAHKRLLFSKLAR